MSEMRPIEVRPARPEEYAAIGDLVALAYLEGGELEGEFDYAAVLRDVADRAVDSLVLVAVREGRLVGSATVLRPGERYAEQARPGELEFRFLAVAPTDWGTGVADELVRDILARAEADSLDTVMFEREGNTAAHRLYARHGFVPRPERDWRPTPDVALLAMVRPADRRAAHR